ncbi:BON domain-containing protein [Methylomicrobium lacus]|uniref:BON domain-containing protein n=1 Tax=Methylomicrobium lacus TaxID=136992 RepID=UPI00045E6EC6|nr:BON domain-containing protein [Methylomicrobium lacus]
MKTINECMQNVLAHRILLITCLPIVLGLAGCEQQGTAEKAGQKIDRAAENAEQKIEQAADRAEQKIDQTTEKAEKQLENAKESVTDKAQSAGEYIDDSVITMNVKAALLNDPFLKSSQIEVTTVNGVVKLSGTVDSDPSIGKAMALASSQPNVKSVQTELTVKASAPGTN